MGVIDRGHVTGDGRSHRQPTATQGIAAVALTMSFDAASTVAGLALAPVLAEQNPIARTMFESVGVLAGVTLVSTVAVLLVVAATELAVRYLDERTDPGTDVRPAVRLVGYGVPSAVSLAVAVHNVALLFHYQALL